MAAYTGSTEAAEREQLEADLLANRVKALVATSALGMGFDKPDLGFVVHLGAPSSPIAYYQQVGRAGPVHRERRGDPAARPRGPRRLALLRLRRVPVGEHGAQRDSASSNPIGRSRRPRWSRSSTSAGPGWRWCSKVLDVDGAVRRVKGGWVATGEPWDYDEPRYRSLDEARKREQQAMLDYQDTDGCRMAFLRSQLDDPGAR